MSLLPSAKSNTSFGTVTPNRPRAQRTRWVATTAAWTCRQGSPENQSSCLLVRRGVSIPHRLAAGPSARPVRRHPRLRCRPRRPGGPGAALALVHRGDAGDRDRRALPRRGRPAAAAAPAAARPTGRRSASRPAAVPHREVARRDLVRGRPSATGNDTGVPGRTRGLYAATTVAPPERVESRNTLPPRSALMYAVVASARVDPLGPGGDRPGRRGHVFDRRRGSSGTNTCTPLAPLVFTAPASPASVSACRTSSAACTAMPERSPPSGGSRSITRCVTRSGRDRRGPASGGTRPPAGWRTTAASGGRCTARTTPPASRPPPRRRPSRTQSGVYFGTFFCMNGCWPRPDPDHRQRPVAQPGDDPVVRQRPGSRPGPAWSRPRRRTAAGPGWSAPPRHGSRPLSLATRSLSHQTFGVARPLASYGDRSAGKARSRPRPRRPRPAPAYRSPLGVPRAELLTRRWPSGSAAARSPSAVQCSRSAPSRTGRRSYYRPDAPVPPGVPFALIVRYDAEAGAGPRAARRRGGAPAPVRGEPGRQALAVHGVRQQAHREPRPPRRDAGTRAARSSYRRARPGGGHRLSNSRQAQVRAPALHRLRPAARRARRASTRERAVVEVHPGEREQVGRALHDAADGASPRPAPTCRPRGRR